MGAPLKAHYPKLRPVEAQPVVHRGRSFVLVRDPLQLSEGNLIVPRALSPLLSLCDGTNDVRAFPEILSSQFSIAASEEDIEHVLESLDQAFLLENERSFQAKAAALSDYQRAPFRPPILAGNAYPAEPDDLQEYLDSYLAKIDVPSSNASELRGLVSPHIDFARGGDVYAEVWQRAELAVQAADLIVIFGTDHFGPDTSITLTHQNYATPYGTLPTPKLLVDGIAESIGVEKALIHELQHRGEHAIELAVVWLHHMRRGKACDIIPILCGSFSPFIRGEEKISENAIYPAFIEGLRSVMTDRQTLIVAAADLAHVGPAFGGSPLDLAGHAELHRSDQVLLDQICRGDANSFLQSIQHDEDCNNVCGTAPIYLTIRTLAPVSGEVVGYEHCPADQADRSAVSICGVLLH
jgi:AmmeMemoRadiSam system protein B